MHRRTVEPLKPTEARCLCVAQGLLDFAFSPAFDTNSYFYVSYTIDDDEVGGVEDLLRGKKTPQASPTDKFPRLCRARACLVVALE